MMFQGRLPAAMSISVAPSESRRRPLSERLVGWAESSLLWTLLALAGTIIVGYRFGDSNHGITVPLLKHLIDPSLYPGDPLIATGSAFPTVFYRLVALVLPSTGAVAPAFYAMYVVTMAATFAALYRIGRWAGGPGAGVLVVLIGLPVRIGMAGEALYRVEFSHSHVASALALWAIAWFLEGRRLLPILVLSLGAYNHALYSAYVLAPMVIVVVWEYREVGRQRSLMYLAAATIPWLPLVAWAIAHQQPLSQTWLSLLRLRSAHHSFPGYFGDDLPGVAALLLLAMLSLSSLTRLQQRLVAAFMGATALHFALGTLFTEWWPLRLVLQYQPHRSWRFLMVILWAVVCAHLVAQMRRGGRDRALAIAVAVCLALPGMASLTPWAIVLVALLARPAPPWWQRALVAAVLLGVAGWGIATVNPLLDLDAMLRRSTTDTVIACAGLGIAVLTARSYGRSVRLATVVGSASAVLLWLAPSMYLDLSQRWAPEASPWLDVQHWARLHTPTQATILTPPLETGFRVFSERPVVGEWKDGTQQYFDAAFAEEWDRRMRAMHGDGFAQMSGMDLLAVARSYGASFIVVPRRPRREGLPLLYSNHTYAVYAARWKTDTAGHGRAVRGS
jgi:hypothetical protein